jgi:hypothetical protein
MRPCDPDESREVGLFEQWMELTPEEWETLGEPDGDDEAQS